MIWLVGHNGLLGRELSRKFQSAGCGFIGTGSELDISNPKAVASFEPSKPVDWVINCAAYTAVDAAEEEPERCHAVNVAGAENLAKWAERNHAAMVQFSTDYVFDGAASLPYDEQDALNPLGVYGRSKALGEDAVRSWCPRHWILRAGWLYGTHRPNFVYSVLKQLRRETLVRVVEDQWGSPTWTRDLADFVAALIQGPHRSWGTYHCGAQGHCSRFEFATSILDIARELAVIDAARRVEVVPIRRGELASKALRPAWCVLSKERAQRTFKWEFPQWRSSLRKFMAEAMEPAQY